MTQKPSFNRPHYVDEDTEIVYVAPYSLGGAISAKDWVEQFFPGYKAVLLTTNALQKKITGDANDG